MTAPSDPPNLPPDVPDPELSAFAAKVRDAKAPVATLLRPMSDEKRDSIFARGMEAVEDRSSSAVAKVQPEGKLLQSGGRFRRWSSAAVAVALAAAAGLALFFSLRADDLHPTAYTLEVAGDLAVRGSDAGSESAIHLRPSTRLSVRIRAAAGPAATALRVFVVRDGKARSVKVAYGIDTDGSLTVDAPARDALGDQPNGPAVLVFIVGLTLPSDDALRSLAEQPSSVGADGLVVLRREVVLDDWETGQGPLDLRSIELAGCVSLTAGPTCEVTAESELRLWVPVAGAELSVEGGEAQAPQAVEAGTRFVVRPGLRATRLDVQGPTGQVLFRLPLQASPEDTSLSRTWAALQKNDCAEAERWLHSAMAGAPPTIALPTLRMRARYERRCGDGARAKALLEEAIARDESAGRISDEADDRYLLAFLGMVRDFDFAASGALLAARPEVEERCPECRLDANYYRSMWALETGQLDQALGYIDEVLWAADRLDLTSRSVAARNQRMEVLATLGRVTEARSMAERLAAEGKVSADPCTHARTATSAAWAVLRGADDDASHAAAAALADDGITTAREACPAALTNALVNRAYAEVAKGDARAARAYYEDAVRSADAGDVRMGVWLTTLRLEIALLDDAEEALNVSDKLEAMGQERLSLELHFRAAAGRARALRKLGDLERATAAYAAADESLDRWSALVPFGEGRQSFFEQQARWSQEAVDFHVRRAEGLPEGAAARREALRVAALAAQRGLSRFFDNQAATNLLPMAEQGRYRRSRERAEASAGPNATLQGPNKTALADIQKRLGSRRATAPAQVAPGTVRLVYHRVDSGWVGFAVEADGAVTMARLDPWPGAASPPTRAKGPDGALARALLAPFAAPLARAQRLELPAEGPLRRVPFEALTWNGKTIADTFSVHYKLHVATPEPPSLPCAGTATALVVINPESNLAAAEEAAPEVRKGLSSKGLQVRELSGRTATRAAVLAALEDRCTRHFHYDGHASFAGRDGASAALRLADGPLTVPDILALARVPETVSLLGCETAKDDGMGLAQAFVARGSHEVLAAIDTVADQLSGQVAKGLYLPTDQPNEGTDDAPWLSEALRRATRDVRNSDSAWWVFRVISS